MKIENYFDDYNNQIDSVKLPVTSKHSLTIKDFYDDCISQHLLDTNAVIAWHNMLMEYIKLPGAIFWIRYYESGSKKSGRYNNRRACLTRYSDGFSYVFVSNFDVQEIFNMIDKGVVPTALEFLQLMKDFKYRMHYDTGKSCEESDISAYQNIGNNKAGTLNSYLWYLAHIEGIKNPYKLSNGEIDFSKKKNDSIRDHIFPRGVVSDWQYDPATKKHIRFIKENLTPEEKSIVIAHFLRFVDPLNYFVTPKTSAEIDCIFKDKSKNIGEEPQLTKYVSSQFEAKYGKAYLDEFKKYALVCDDGISVDGNKIIDITYFMAYKVPKIPKTKSTRKKSNSKKSTVKTNTSTTSTKTKTQTSVSKSNSSSACKLNKSQINSLLDDYLINGFSLIALDKKYFNTSNSHGNSSYNFLRENGISNDFKGSIKKGTFNTLLSMITGSKSAILNDYINFKIKTNKTI